MRRELPTQPHIDHLKKQAKDLLDAHRRGDAEALARIRAAVPSFAHLSDDEAARAPFALHDAQSAIAREYGLRSWSELRAEVSKRSGAAFPESLIRSLGQVPLPEAVIAAMSQAWTTRGEAVDVQSQPLPGVLALLPFRNAMLVPGAIVPIHVGRASSLAAVDAALAATPPTLAVFSQRDAGAEGATLESFHGVGCQALVHERVDTGDGRAFVILQGLRWVVLEAIDAAGPGGFAVAHVAPRSVAHEDPDDGGGEALFEELRARARLLAGAMPQADRVLALIESIDLPERLSDMVIANLPCPVEEKARYAAEPRLAGRLRVAIDLCEAQLAASGRV